MSGNSRKLLLLRQRYLTFRFLNNANSYLDRSLGISSSSSTYFYAKRVPVAEFYCRRSKMKMRFLENWGEKQWIWEGLGESCSLGNMKRFPKDSDCGIIWRFRCRSSIFRGLRACVCVCPKIRTNKGISPERFLQFGFNRKSRLCHYGKILRAMGFCFGSIYLLVVRFSEAL